MSDGGCLSVASFNLLAPAYVRPLDSRTGEVQAFAAFEWAEPAAQVLAWEARAPRLLAELRACGADVICLQELQLERAAAELVEPTAGAAEANAGVERTAPKGELVFPAWLRPMLDEAGYVAQLPPAAECETMAARNARVLGVDATVCNALLYRADRLELVAKATNEGKGDKDSTTCVALCVRGRAGSALGALAPTVVVSVHLDATSEAKRVRQVASCLRRSRKLAATVAARGGGALPPGGQPLTIIAGDMNTEILPGSCVAAFLAATAMEDGGADREGLKGGVAGGGRLTPLAPTAEQLAAECASALRLADGASPSEAQLAEWDVLWAEAAAAVREHRVGLARVATQGTRAAFDHVAQGEGSAHTMGTWRLDHILYTTKSAQPVAYWGTLEDDAEAAATGLPNHCCPSDHLPIAAVFRPLKAPTLDAAAAEALRARMAAVDEEHAAAQSALTAALEMELAAVEAAIPPAAPEVAADGAAATAAAPGGEPVAAGKTAAQKAKKAKKVKKGPPPAAVIEFMRHKRARMSDLKAAQRAARETLVVGLSDLELDVVEEYLGHGVGKWVEEAGKGTCKGGQQGSKKKKNNGTHPCES